MRTWLALALVLVACSSDAEPDGDTGSAALSSTAYQPLGSVACNAALDLVGADRVNETGLRYTVTIFSNGDMLTDCNAGLGGLESSADSNYFPATSMGATNGACVVSLDYPFPDSRTVGFWMFTMDMDDGPQAEYMDDAAHPLDGARYVFFENDCAVRAYDGERWRDWSLGELLRR